jgi:CelD/BcsL family acetyltransferase involved in cellulose biosynthesis
MTEPAKLPPEITATPITDLDQVAREWCALERHSVNHSFFLSWYWIGSWLRSLPERTQPLLLRIKSGGHTIGLGVTVHSNAPVLKFFHLPQITLNATGEAGLDRISIEYNGFLAASGQAEMVTQRGLEWLLQDGVPNQSLLLPGIDEPVSNAAIGLAHDYGRIVTWLNRSPAPYVDLTRIRNDSKEYLSCLSRNTRQMIRRSIRYYESYGPLRYHCASSLEEALGMLEELAQAHQKYWRSRSRPGAFSEPFFKGFHETLIRSAFANGHIELARISAGDRIIGYLYNFLWRGGVFTYQSGFHYEANTAAKPGYVSHYLAILHALDRGYNIYDFMAGGAQHKFSLSTDQKDLDWLQLRTPVLPVRLESGIRALLANVRRRTVLRRFGASISPKK